MKISVTSRDPHALVVDLLVIPLFEGAKKLTGRAALIEKALGDLVADHLAQDKFEGKLGETIIVRSMGKVGPTKIALVGAGKKSFTIKNARTLAAQAASLARTNHAKSVAFVIPDALAAPMADVSEALTEGAILGDYRFFKYMDEQLKEYTDDALTGIELVVSGKKDVANAEKGVRLGYICSHANILARGLVNEPASHATPSHLADVARALAAAHPKRMSIQVYDEQALKEMKAGGILAVSKGSDEPPFMVHLTYTPALRPGSGPSAKKARRKVVVVGKGITFDSGGLSLKPADGMMDMKIDMAGCAAMLGVMSALSELAPDVEVHGISAICENMPSGKATRPGDIVRTMSGKTIEILNTDAEGRVTLADTLWYGAQLKPDYMIDLATLTGACMVALGNDVAGLMSNDRKLAAKLLASGEREGEALWELPLVDGYRKLIKSKQADLKNIGGGRYGGAITAGLFLEAFVDGTKWAHLDIAGPAWTEKEGGHQPYGATGFGVRTVVDFIQNL